MLPSAPQLLAQQARIEQRIDEVTATVDAVTNQLTPAAQSAFDQLWTDLEALKQLIENRARLDTLERRASTRQIGGGDPQFAAFTRPITISDAIAATLGSESRGAGMAREASAEIARQRGKNPAGIFLSLGSAAAAERGAVVTTGAYGTPNVSGPLVPTIVRGDLLIDALRAALVLEDLGATFLTELTGNQSIPRTSQGTTVGWFAENAPIPNTSIGFDSVTLAVKHVGAIIEYSRNTLLNATPDIDALLRSDLMRALAVEIERAALAGCGDGIIPRGIINTAGVQTVSMGNSLTWPELVWGFLCQQVFSVSAFLVTIDR